jgi:hypothetical protein
MCALQEGVVSIQEKKIYNWKRVTMERRENEKEGRKVEERKGWR